MSKQPLSILRSEFARNVLTLMTGTVIGQVVALLLSPIITRLFSPEDFTTLEQYTMLLNILVVAVTGKYEFAIMQPREREDARHLVILTMRIALISSTVLFVLLLLFGDYVGAYYQNDDLSRWLWTLPATLLAFAVFNSINFWFTRQKKYRVAATSKIWNSAASEPVKILTGWLKWSSGGLIIATIFGNVMSALYVIREYLRDEPKGFGHVQPGKLKEVAASYSNYPKYTIWGSMFSRIAQWAHIGLFSHFYGAYAIGYMALCRRIFMNPLNIVSGSFAQVFFQRISEITDPGELYRFYMKNLFRFLGFAALSLGVVLILPSQTMGFVFGEKWMKAMEFLKILAFWYALNFVTSSLSHIFYRLQAQKMTLVLDVIHLMIVVAAIYGSVWAGLDEIAALKVLVACKMAVLLLILFISIWMLRRQKSILVVHEDSLSRPE